MEFESGLQLLEEVDPKSIHLRMFKRSGSTSFNQSKLEELLRNVVVQVNEVGAEPQSAMGFPKYDFFSLPKELQQIHFRKAELYKEAGETRVKMLQATTDQQRGILADKVMKLMSENQECWEMLDYFIQYGSMKKDLQSVIPDLEGMDMVQMLKFKTNNASNLSKWRKKLKAITAPEQRKELELKITKHESLQEKVIEIINSGLES